MIMQQATSAAVVACLLAVCILPSAVQGEDLQTSTCGPNSKFSVVTNLLMAAEAASERANYECHCDLPTPQQQAESIEAQLGLKLKKNGKFKPRQLNEQSPVPHARVLVTVAPLEDCSAKTKFDIAKGYGDIRKARKCFDSALVIFTSNWNKEVTGPAIRAGFHDCGTYESTAHSGYGHPPQCGGCNGSFKQEFERGLATEFCEFPQQNGHQLFYEWMWSKKNVAGKVRKVPECKNISNADLISLASYFAVQQAGGVPQGGCNWYPGRVDAVGYDDTTRLPGENLDAYEQSERFTTYGFDAAQKHFGLNSIDETVATLTGAHTCGRSRVHPQNAVSLGLGDLAATPYTFNGDYYVEVSLQGGYNGATGWFASDLHHRCNKFRIKTSAEFDESKGSAAANGRLPDDEAVQLINVLPDGNLELTPVAQKAVDDVATAAASGQVISGEDEVIEVVEPVEPPALAEAAEPVDAGTDDNPDVKFEKITCAYASGDSGKSATDSPFFKYSSAYAKEHLTGKPNKDARFHGKFCQAFMAMSTIGYQFPADWDTVSTGFKFKKVVTSQQGK